MIPAAAFGLQFFSLWSTVRSTVVPQEPVGNAGSETIRQNRNEILSSSQKEKTGRRKKPTGHRDGSPMAALGVGESQSRESIIKTSVLTESHVSKCPCGCGVTPAWHTAVTKGVMFRKHTSCLWVRPQGCFSRSECCIHLGTGDERDRAARDDGGGGHLLPLSIPGGSRDSVCQQKLTRYKPAAGGSLLRLRDHESLAC